MVTMRLDGVDAFLAELERLAPDLVDEANPLAAELAEQAADEIRANVPVATGALRASVQVRRGTARGQGQAAAQVVVGADYADQVEFGTPFMAPRPVFVPAVRRSRQAFVNAVVGRVRDRGLTVRGDLH